MGSEITCSWGRAFEKPIAVTSQSSKRLRCRIVGYADTRKRLLRRERSSEAASRQSSGQQQGQSESSRRNSFRGSDRPSRPARFATPQATKQENFAKPRPTPHSIPTICRSWEANGTCSYGDKCIFQHPRDDEKRGAKRSGDEPARPAKRELR